MPRKNPVPERERQICARVKEFRGLIGLSRVAYAKEARVDSSRLATIEQERAPLKFGVALQLFKKVGISPHWLATGEPPKASRLWLDFSGLKNASPLALFSAVYDENAALLWPERGKVVSPWEDELTDESAHDANGRVVNAWILSSLIEGWLERIRDEDVRAFVNRLFAYIDDCGKDAGVDAPGTVERRKLQMETIRILRHRNESKAEKELLTADSEYRKTPDMKSELPGLLKKVARLTATKGMKSRLATELGVPLPRISEWLGGKYAPSGDVAIKLLRWVEQHEGK